MSIEQREFFDLKLRGTEVNEQPMLDFASAEISKNLRSMSRIQIVAGFNLNNQRPREKQVGNILPQNRIIFVANFERKLKADDETRFTQSMRKTVFVDFLQVSMT